MFANFIAPTVYKLPPRSLYALNRKAIMDRIEAGYPATHVLLELSEFLKKSGHASPAYVGTLYHFLKLEKGESKARKSPLPAPARPTPPTIKPDLEPPTKPKFFDADTRHDISDIL